MEYISPEDLDGGLEIPVRIIVQVRNTFGYVMAETSQGMGKLSVHDIGVIVKLEHKSLGTIREVSATRSGQRFYRNVDHMSLTCNVLLERTPENDPLQLVAILIRQSDGQYLLDPTTKETLSVQKTVNGNNFCGFYLLW